MGVFELTKLVSLYKSYCKGYLTPDIVKAEIIDTKCEADKEYCKTGVESKDLQDYIQELEILLFDIMHYNNEC